MYKPKNRIFCLYKHNPKILFLNSILTVQKLKMYTIMNKQGSQYFSL